MINVSNTYSYYEYPDKHEHRARTPILPLAESVALGWVQHGHLQTTSHTGHGFLLRWRHFSIETWKLSNGNLYSKLSVWRSECVFVLKTKTTRIRGGFPPQNSSNSYILRSWVNVWFGRALAGDLSRGRKGSSPSYFFLLSQNRLAYHMWWWRCLKANLVLGSSLGQAKQFAGLVKMKS